ncbi:MAG: leucyl/phenylalanyl-tRNA--protein transferase [Kiritimatiellia bacterium]|jgi:leucyl/phenylalanyl-tRNA--protein transferase|nr:leucyl/phenylalanyl-tRNA--protein transferase [Kiritimatiellia bacterium]
MPVFQLTEDLAFPPVELTEPLGYLAVGGDLSVERLLLAYQSGIFPWPLDEHPLVWWAPNPRFVLYPEKLRVTKSLRRIITKGEFKITYDQAFPRVIEGCRLTVRKGQDDTWITREMMDAYIRLHEAGYAHSVESWIDGELAGGLYGVSLGRCFFGESMFTKERDASKCAFVSLVERLKEMGFPLIDCQVETDHLRSFGAREIPRNRFMSELANALTCETLKGNWGELLAEGQSNPV